MRIKGLIYTQPLAAASRLLLQVLSFVQSLRGELIPSFKSWFQHHLLLQGFSPQLYAPLPTCLHSLYQSSPPTPLTTLSISYLIATLLYVSVLGCPEDLILVNIVSIAPRRLPGPREALQCLRIIWSGKLECQS